MAKNASPAVVAELGRPETPEETAARKAEQSRLYRDRKTLRNLIYAVLVSVGLVIAIVFLVPRTETSLLQPVDYQQVAVQAQASMPVPLTVPALPEGWSSNAAELRSGGADDITSWYIGLISPKNQYVGVTQAVDANPTWLAEQVARGDSAGTVMLDGVEWTAYDNRGTGTDVGNVAYALVTEAGRSTFVVFGTADVDEISTVASAVSEDVLAQPSADETGSDSGSDSGEGTQ
ncbi:DUF4245 domain-containing protein [Herbiconiux sp.]|uniref:DUF4245 domain-containing protein n=1 Tax=Herbiconiux sp. TaxID=1871186 RepID=UPI0025BC94BF|nr:DUF4245 domain-containing protein [Herbiconiux sp.]